MTLAARGRGREAFKGLLTLLMVYCHVLQFYGDASLSPPIGFWMDLANLTVFPGFVFAYGRAVAAGYYCRPFREAAPRMLISAGKLYGAFFLSGLAFRVLRENKPFGAGIAKSILLLKDIPGWSEFIIAFALYALLALLLFRPLRWLSNKPLGILAASLLCLAACFIPYDSVRDPRLSLFIGGRQFAYFPVVQYAPYFLVGLLFRQKPGKIWQWLLAALALGGLGLLRALQLGGLPSRFPPDIGWVLLGAVPVALAAILGSALAGLPGRLPAKLRPAAALAFRPLMALGHGSLYYLLASNLALFTLAGKNLAPLLKFKAPGLFGQPVQTAPGAFWWTMALLLSSALTAGFVRQPGKPHLKKEDSPCAPSASS